MTPKQTQTYLHPSAHWESFQDIEMFLGSHRAEAADTDMVPQWRPGWWHSSTLITLHTQRSQCDPWKLFLSWKNSCRLRGKFIPHPVSRMGWAYAHYSQRDMEGKGIALRWGWKTVGSLIRLLGTESKIPGVCTTIRMYLPCELPASDWQLWGKGRQCCWNLCIQEVFVEIWLHT